MADARVVEAIGPSGVHEAVCRMDSDADGLLSCDDFVSALVHF